MSSTQYRALVLGHAIHQGPNIVSPQVLRSRLDAYHAVMERKLDTVVCASCARARPRSSAQHAVFATSARTPVAPEWLSWPPGVWELHSDAWLQALDRLFSIDEYWSKYFDGPNRRAQAAAAAPDSPRAATWHARVETWAENILHDLYHDSVASPLGTRWLLLPSAILAQTDTTIECYLCRKCSIALRALSSDNKPRPTHSVVCRARGQWGGPEPPELRRLSWLGRRILQLACPVVSIKTVGAHTNAPYDAESSQYLIGNVLVFPQRGGAVARALGLLPADLVCDVALRYEADGPTSLTSDPSLRVSLPDLRAALRWYLTHNWQWLLATAHEDIDPSTAHLGATLETLLQMYRDSIAPSNVGVPCELLRTATASGAAPLSSTDTEPPPSAAVLDPDIEDQTPVGLWALAMRKYDALQNAKDDPSADVAAILQEAIHALRLLASDETAAQLDAWQRCQDATSLILTLPKENELLDTFDCTIWARSFCDLFYRDDCREFYPGTGRPLLRHSRRWLKTLFHRVDFTGWSQSKEFAAVAANILLRRDQMDAINSWIRLEHGGRRIRGALAELTVQDFHMAFYAHGQDIPSLKQAAAATKDLPGPLHSLFREMLVVLRHVDGSDSQRAQTVHRMRALRTWFGCTFLFFTLNPADHRNPLTMGFLNGHSISGPHLPTPPSHDLLRRFFGEHVAADPTIFRRLANRHPLAAMRAIRFTFERTLDTLFNCSLHKDQPLQVDATALKADLFAADTVPGVLGHIAAYYGVVETTKSMREHLHMMLHIINFEHPEDLLSETATSTFQTIWQYIASIIFHSDEAFARYTHPSAGLHALSNLPLMHLTAKQSEQLGEDAAAVPLAQLRARGLSCDTSLPEASPIPHLPWPQPYHGDPSVPAALWAEKATTQTLRANQTFGNHVCRPATCRKKKQRHEYCRMFFWHWRLHTRPTGKVVARRHHGCPLFPQWSGSGDAPLNPFLPHENMPALERTHPFHCKFTPAISLGPSVNHDLGLLFRFPSAGAHGVAAAVENMAETITDHEYYAAGYLAKDQDAAHGLLSVLHAAKLQYDRRMAEENTTPDEAQNVDQARRLFSRLIFATNQRFRWGFQSVYAYLIGKPFFYCSHSFVPLSASTAFFSRVEQLVLNAETDSHLRRLSPTAGAFLPSDPVPKDPPPAGKAPTYTAYDYAWRDEHLDCMSLYFFTAGTNIVTRVPDHGWTWPRLLDGHGNRATHPCIERRRCDPRFQKIGRVSGTWTPLFDPHSGEPLRTADHYRELETTRPWRIPELFGYMPPAPAETSPVEDKGRFALFTMLLFRPWRNPALALVRWVSPTLEQSRLTSPCVIWEALYTSYMHWRGHLQATWLEQRGANVAPASQLFWDILTYHKVRNFELVAKRKHAGVYKVPLDPTGAPYEVEAHAPTAPASLDTESLSASDSNSNATQSEPGTPNTDEPSDPPHATTPAEGPIACGDICPTASSHWSYCSTPLQELTKSERLYAVGLWDQLHKMDLTPDTQGIGSVPTVCEDHYRHPWPCAESCSAVKPQATFFADLDSAGVGPGAASSTLAPDLASDTDRLPGHLSGAIATMRIAHPRVPYRSWQAIDAAIWLIQQNVFYIKHLNQTNVKQARALLLAATWLQTRLDHIHGIPPRGDASAVDHVILITGGAGSGKTTVLLVIEKLYEHFLGSGCMLKAAPTNTAARLLHGDTLHAVHRLPRHTLAHRGRLTAPVRARHRRMWESKIGHALDEISMTGAQTLYHVDQRTRSVTDATLPFGGKFTLLLGDFLQLPPIGTPSLAAPPDAYVNLDLESQQGHDLWRQIRRVVQLDFNMRTSGLLATILDQMRHGSLDDKTWHALKARQVEGPESHLFDATTQWIVNRHSLRAALAYTITLRQSSAANRTFFLVHAADDITKPHHCDLDEPDVRRRLLSLANPRRTGDLPGILPCYIGCRYRLYSQKLCVQLGLMNGALVELLHLYLSDHDRDFAAQHHAGDLTVLRHLPRCLVLRAVDAVWTLPDACVGHLRPHLDDLTGVFLLHPLTTYFPYTLSSLVSVRVRRTAFPLLPANVCITYAAQGESWPRVVLDMSMPPRTDPHTHWLCMYVQLSRARNLDQLHVLRLPPRTAFEVGPPHYLRDELSRLHTLETATTDTLRAYLTAMPDCPPFIRALFTGSAAPCASPTGNTSASTSNLLDAIPTDFTQKRPPAAPATVAPLKRCRFKQPVSASERPLVRSAATPTGPARLLNRSNTCYINALLTALAQCPALQTWLTQHLGCQTHLPSVCCAPALAADIQSLRSEHEPFHPRLAETRGAWNPSFANSDHQDAHEALMAILSNLHRCETLASNPNHIRNTPFWLAFGAEANQTITCQRCSASCNTTTHILPFHIPADMCYESSNSLEAHLQQSSASVPDRRCPECGATGASTQETTLTRTGAALLITIGRWLQPPDGGTIHKDSRPIHAPTTVHLCQRSYRLYASVLHAGTLTHGHYTTVVSHPTRGWLLCDDAAPPQPIEDVHAAARQHYILLYNLAPT